MTIKSVFNYRLMGALLCALTLSLTACSDDDDENVSSAEKQEQEAAALTAKGEAFWNVVGQLSTATSLPDDWETATFEPAYGEADENNALQRVVVVNSAGEAARLFSNLVGVEIDGDATEYTFSDDNVGTLTYRRSTDGRSMATVDVSIRQMPRLQKILYKTPDQLGTNTIFNGRFDGGAYYRFGDVVRKLNSDHKPEYWICVRPAFSYENKGDSHWITLSALPEKNLFHHHGSNGIDYYLPTDLGVNTTHEKNFAEMLYAVLNPQQWMQNINNNAKLDVFNGFDRDYLDFHNADFWKLVAQGWQEASIMERCFGGVTMDQLRQNITADGLTLIYDSKWHTSISWSPTIYTRNYSGANLKTVKKQSVSTNVKQQIELDMRDSYYRAFQKNSGFFGDSKARWIIRHATGKDLGGHDDPKRPLGNGVEEVYVFNSYYYAARNLDEDDDIFTDRTNTGHGYYLPGDVVKDPQGNRWFCAQTAMRLEGEAHNDYSYFVSFDPGALRNGDDPLGNLPSRNLAWQMVYEMTNQYTNYIINYAEGAPREYVTSLLNNCEIDLSELLATHGFHAEGHDGLVKVYCGNALYKDDNNAKAIARLIYDMAALQPNGGRDMRYSAYDQYTTAPARKMLLSDLFDQQVVSKYKVENKWGDKPWIVPPYRGDAEAEFENFSQRERAVTQTSLEQWYNKPGFKFLDDYNDERAGYNMYTEPVMVFAVKRLHDTGAVNHRFDDGTRMLVYKNVDDFVFGNDYKDVGVVSYTVMSQDAIFINDQLGGFGISNER